MTPSDPSPRISSGRGRRFAVLATLVVAAAAILVIGRQTLRSRGTVAVADGVLAASVDAMEREEVSWSHADVDSPDTTPPSEPYDNPEDDEQQQAMWEAGPPAPTL